MHDQSLPQSRTEERGRIYLPSTEGQALRQSEILSNLRQPVPVSVSSEDEATVELVIHPYALLVTQDCDLDWDFKARNGLGGGVEKQIPSLLFCQIQSAAALKPLIPGSTFWKRIKQNQEERYQFLQKVQPGEDALGEGIPELGVDFKKCFTLPTEFVYKEIADFHVKRRCRFARPYLEHLTVRFHNFCSRVALPAEHASEPNS